MTPKALLIPLAAFALTVTTANAFGPEVLENAGLTSAQIAAFEEARELRNDGERDEARDVLIDAGIDVETMDKIRAAMHTHWLLKRSRIQDATLENNFEAFKSAIVGSPLEDIVLTKSDFELFREAYVLRENGEFDEAKRIMDDLGMNQEDGIHYMPAKTHSMLFK